MKETSVTYVVLGILSFGPRSGYEIKALVDKSTRFFWAASYGQIYPELKRLEREGLVAGGEEPTGARPRTVYRLTEKGREALQEWLRETELTYELRDEGLVKLFFAENVGRDGALELLRAMRGRHEAILERLHTIEPLARKSGDYRLLVLECGLALHAATAAWCADAEARLREGS